MTHNEILRRIRLAIDFDDSTLMAIFALAETVVTPDQIHSWSAQEDAPEFKPLDDLHLARFLNGLIIKNRGKKEGPTVEAESALTPNTIFRKLRIALQFNDVDVMEAMKLAGSPIGKQELSALFRNPAHKNFRACRDETLLGFLKGLRLKLRPMEPAAES